VEIIEVSSDSDTPPPGDPDTPLPGASDTPPPGNSSNPIVLDSSDEEDQQGTSVHPLPEASQPTPRRKNIHPNPPSRSNHLALSLTLQSSSPPDTSITGDEFRDTESLSVRRALLSPHSEYFTQAVDQPSVVNGKTDRTPLPIEDTSEIQDKMPNGVSDHTREASSHVASSPSPTRLKSRNKGIFDGLAISRMSSSPNRSHLPPISTSADSSVSPVRGTLHSGRSGLFKFFRVTTAGPASSKPSRDVDVEEEGGVRSKEAPTPPLANSPRKTNPTTLVSLTQNMSIRSSPTPPRINRSGLEISDDPAITTLESVSSALIGEPSRRIIS
jgi:hypothetical protein